MWCMVRFKIVFSSKGRNTRLQGDWISDVCSSDLEALQATPALTVKSHTRTVVDRYDDCPCVKIGGRMEVTRRSLVLGSAAREKWETPGTAPHERGHAGCVLAGLPVRLRPVAGRPSGRAGELSARS